jgi:serine/threonine protein kinase
MPAPESPTVSGLPAEKLMAAAMAGTPVSSPAFAWVPPTAGEIAPWFPDYEIQSLAGRGGMGAVYRAIHRKLSRPVAIKLLPAELAARDGVSVRFEREARALAQLNHPGIVALHDFGRAESGHLFIVMEYVDGTDLSRLLHAEGGALGVPQALEIVSQVCDALQYAHNHGFVHRDIKPGNVLVDREGRVKIADFGLAKFVEEKRGSAAPLSATGLAVGTPDYTAPEQLRGGPVDHRADIYSLGVMFYEMLTGDLPRGAWTPPSQRTAAPVRLDEVVNRAMQSEPDRRYQQASEVKAAAVGQGPPPQPARNCRARALTDRVLVWLMLAAGAWMVIACPTGDILTLMLVVGPYVLLAWIFSRWRLGSVGGIIAGIALAFAVWFSVSQHSDDPRSREERQRRLSNMQDALLADQVVRVKVAREKMQSLQRNHDLKDFVPLNSDGVAPAQNPEGQMEFARARQSYEAELATLARMEDSVRQARADAVTSKSSGQEQSPLYRVTSRRDGRLAEVKVSAGQHVVPGSVVAVLDPTSLKIELQGLKDEVIERLQKESSAWQRDLMSLEAEFRQAQTGEAEDTAICKELEAVITAAAARSPNLPAGLVAALEDQRTARVDLARANARRSARSIQLAQIQESIHQVKSKLESPLKSAEALGKTDMGDEKIVSLLPLTASERQRRLSLLQSIEDTSIRTVRGGVIQNIAKEPGDACAVGGLILTMMPDEEAIPANP